MRQDKTIAEISDNIREEDLMEDNAEDGCDRDFEEFRDDDNGF